MLRILGMLDTKMKLQFLLEYHQKCWKTDEICSRISPLKILPSSFLVCLGSILCFRLFSNSLHAIL